MYGPMSDAAGLTVRILFTGSKLMKAGRVNVPCKTISVIIGLQAASTTELERLYPTGTIAGSMGVLQSYEVAKGAT